MPYDPPLVVVHLAILKQAACHDCGWQGDLHDRYTDAEAEAEAHTHGGTTAEV